VVMLVTKASIITMPITPMRAVVKAEFILPIYFSSLPNWQNNKKERNLSCVPNNNNNYSVL
jgi:hypothetical protein